MRMPFLLSSTTLAILALTATGAQAQVAPAAAASASTSATQGDAALGNVIVTGTRATNRTVADSVSPVQVLSQDAIQKSGKFGLQEALTNVLPSLSLPAISGGNLTSLARIATLRGLNPDHVLVLLNGKRFHSTSIVNVAGSVAVGSQGVDLNMIPVASIQRIEVLTDGAAAQYGSDAIAGVINIIMKKDASGGSASVQLGQYYDGDGENQQYTINQGVKLGGDGYLNLSAMGNKQNGTNRASRATITNRYYPGDPRNNTDPGIVYRGYGIPESTSKALSFNAGKPVNDNVNLYGFGTYTEAVGKNWVGFRAASNDNNVVAIYPDGFEPRLVVAQKDSHITAGAKGDNLLGFNWDASVTHGKNKSKAYLNDSLNPTYGTASPTSFYLGNFEAGETTGNLDFSREFAIPQLAAPLNVAFGAEVRHDTYAINAGDVASYADGGVNILTGPKAGQAANLPGAQAFGGFRPADALSQGRTSSGAYLDLDTKLTSKWEVGFASRFEHYTDFGNNVSGKLSTRYDVNPTIAFRGAVGNGFRAPSLGQQYYSAGATAQYQGRDYTIANIPVQGAAAKALGAQPLKAERSTNYSVGLVLKPMDRMTVTVDAYQIKLRGRIVQSGQIGLSPSGVLDPALGTLLAGQGISGINAVRYFLNGADTTTSGVDIVTTYKTDFARYGAVDWTLAGNFNNTKIDQVLQAGKATSFGTQVFNQVSQDQLTMPNPKNKFVLSADWTLGKWRVFARESRYGRLTNPSTVATGYSKEGVKYVTDLELGYTVMPRMVVSIGAQNVFDKYPDRTNPANFSAATFNGAQLYNAASPFGTSGGNYYARLNYSWL